MISQTDLIERWENVARVLGAMTEHERRKHWDMSVWGRITECGTVHCAAGRCGLDPWFRDRGFKMDFDQDGNPRISDVHAFFGSDGAQAIFLNTTTRSVERVIEETSAYVSFLKEVAAIEAKIDAPAVGDVWSGYGGIYAGIIRGQDGTKPYAIIVGPELDGFADWDTAMKWASEIKVDDFNDFSLPSRAEAPRLRDTVPQLFKPTWYWLSDQHASNSDHAWSQTFYDGNQYFWLKDSSLRVRAVRRLVIAN